MANLEERVGVLEKEFSRHLSIEKHSREKMNEVVNTLATKDDLKRLENSVEVVVDLIKNFRIGVQVSGKIFGFSGRAVVKFGAFCAGVLAIVAGANWFFGTYVGAKIMGFFHFL